MGKKKGRPDKIMVKRVVEEEVAVEGVITADTFGARLRFLRVQVGLSQDALAQKAALSSSAVRQWEQSRTLPSLPAAMQIAQALGITLDILCGLAPLPEPAQS